MQSNFSLPGFPLPWRLVMPSVTAPGESAGRIAQSDATAREMPGAAGEARPALPPRTLRERLRRPLLVLVPLLLAVGGLAYYVTQAPYVSTDDAFVRAANESINARVSGQVIDIAVADNQPVRKGQLLFRIDPAPYRIAVARAAAKLASARLQVEELRATYGQQLSDLQSAKDLAAFDAVQLARQQALVKAGWTPRESFDRATTDFNVARQKIASDEQQVASTVAALDGDPAIPVARHPAVRTAQAALDQAKLNLSYATVVAPEDGIVTRVDDLQAGDFVRAGAAEFSLMSRHRIWIEANFRETDLTHMHPGQEATLRLDAYPGHSFKVHVVSMSPGTGSEFSMLPPENATGNWVKVVQRLPVRLAFDAIDPARPLFSGLSGTVRIDTGCVLSWRHPFRLSCSVGAGR